MHGPVFARAGVEIGKLEGRDLAHLGALDAHGHGEAFGAGLFVDGPRQATLRHAEQGRGKRPRAVERRQAQARQRRRAAQADDEFDGFADRHHGAARTHIDGETLADGVDEGRRTAGLRQRPHREPLALALRREQLVAGPSEAEGVARRAALQSGDDADRGQVQRTDAPQGDARREREARIGPAALAHLCARERKPDLLGAGREEDGIAAAARRLHLHAVEVEQRYGELVAVDVLGEQPLHRRIEGLADPDRALRQAQADHHVVGRGYFAHVERDGTHARLDAGLFDALRRYRVAAGTGRGDPPAVVERHIAPLGPAAIDDLDARGNARINAEEENLAAIDLECRRFGHRVLLESLSGQRQRERHVGVPRLRRRRPAQRSRCRRRRHGQQGRKHKRRAVPTRRGGTHQSFSTGCGAASSACRRRCRSASRSRIACSRRSAWRCDICSSSGGCGCAWACCCWPSAPWSG